MRSWSDQSGIFVEKDDEDRAYEEQREREESMEATVIQFPKAPRPAKAVDDANYYCVRCSGTNFLISGQGRIVCTGCSARMKNLVATRVENAS